MKQLRVIDVIDLLHPERSAFAPIRGYLYQAAVGVERWLDLGEDEILLCEGDEDLDRLLLEQGSGISEQLKSYSGRLGWSSQAVGESVGNFLKAFVARRQQGERRAFVFTTTAERQPSGRGLDVLAVWHDPAHREGVVDAIRSRLAAAAADETAWLDAQPGGWTELIAAIEWRFGAPDVEAVQAHIEACLARRWPDKGPAELLAARLLAESFRAHAQPSAGLRVLDRYRLLRVLGESEAQLQAWAVSGERFYLDKLRALIRDELQARQLESEEQALEALLHSGREPVGENISPVALLRAGAQVVSFFGRSNELSALDAWVQADAQALVWVFTGDGGTGKTRLLVEWVDRLRARGVRAGFLKKEVPELGDLFGAGGRRVIVVDYAENRLAEVRAIAQRLAEEEQGSHRPFRLVLLARGLGEWWDELGASDFRVGAMLASFGRCSELQPLVPDPEERLTLYGLAVDAFQRLIRPSGVTAQPPALNGNHFARVLYVLMAALAAVDGRTVAEAVDLLDATVEHERRYWQGAARAAGLAAPLERIFARSLERSVVLLTLWGGRSSRESLRQLVHRAGGFPPSQSYLDDELVEVLVRMYGEGDGARGLEPDLVGEHLVQRTLQRGAEPVLTVAVKGAGEAEARSLLTVLNRLANRRGGVVDWLRIAIGISPAKLAFPAMDIAVAVGDPVGRVLAEVLIETKPFNLARSILQRIDVAHHRTTALRETAVIATEIVLQVLVDAGMKETESMAEIARLTNNLGARFDAVGMRDLALGAFKGGAELHRRLADQQPARFLPSLATSLDNLGRGFAHVGQHAAALKAAREATEIFKALTDERPDAFRPSLAKALNNLGTTLKDLRQLEPAFDAVNESVAMYRAVHEEHPGSHLIEFVAALNNLGNRLSELGHHRDALQTAQESVALAREAAQKNPDALLPTLAACLFNLAVTLKDDGRLEEALVPALEAAAIRTGLAEQRPQAFLVDLAASENAVGAIQAESHQYEQARVWFEKAVRSLMPVFHRFPLAVEHDMRTYFRSYLIASQITGKPPEPELVRQMSGRA